MAAMRLAAQAQMIRIADQVEVGSHFVAAYRFFKSIPGVGGAFLFAEGVLGVFASWRA